MPASWAALFIIFAVGVPGFVYQRAVDRSSPERVNTALQELLSVTFGGALISGFSAILLVAAAQALPARVDVAELVRHPRLYGAGHVTLLASWFTVGLACSCVIAWIAGSRVWLRPGVRAGTAPLGAHLPRRVRDGAEVGRRPR